MNLVELVRAVSCAIAILDGEAGGYSVEEKGKAKQALITFNQQLQETIRETAGSL